MSLLDGVKEILKAIPAIVAEDARLDEKHGIDPTVGLRLFDDRSMIRMLEINGKAETLKAYLGIIDYEMLLKLEALMYFGRDRDATFAEKLDYFRRPQRGEVGHRSDHTGKGPGLRSVLQRCGGTTHGGGG